MFMEMIYTPGVAHLSYMIGDKGRAAVIDPRRDIDGYIEIARNQEVQITHIFETHRNEDYAIGSLDLARATGAEIYHGSQLDFKYGIPVYDGDSFTLGNVNLSILHTPGHTMESISIVLADLEFSNHPLSVFSGDALFIGDVGRTDFFPDRADEVAGMLYDSIFDKLLPLGDHVLLWPAHGAGSVCGSGMAHRNFSTLGYERLRNPVLQKTDRDEFIHYKTSEHHFQPPYFRQMEKYNLEGAPPIEFLPRPKAFSPDQFAQAADNGMIVVDTRRAEAFAGAHVPGSLSLPLNALSAHAGMYLDYDRPIGLVVDNPSQVVEAVRSLIRIGYDNIEAFLAGGLHDWEAAGYRFETVKPIHVSEVEQQIDNDVDFILLDVRSEEEFRAGHLRNALNIYMGDIPSKIDQIPKDRKIVTFCDTGRRAMTAASVLLRNGFEHIENCLGSLSACSRTKCEILTNV